MKRSNFLRLGTLGGLTIRFPWIFSMGTKNNATALPKRILGKTGEKISVIGFGGIALRNNGQDFANETVAEAYDMGVSYFDIAPSYGDSQSLLGPALEPYRQKVFLACKSNRRDEKGATAELNESLRQLRTDHVDLYQLHGLTTMEELDQCFAAGGAMETLLKARKEGKVRFLGFSAHDEDVALEAIERFDFDTILFPINCVCWHNGNFGPEVVQKAREKDMGVLALKAVAKEPLGDAPSAYPNMWYKPFENEEEIVQAFRFTFSKGITATVHAGDVKFMRKFIELAGAASGIRPPDGEMIQSMIRDIQPIFNRA